MYLRIEADNNPNGYARKRLRLYKEPDTCTVFRETYSHTDTLPNIRPPYPFLPNVNAGASIGETLNPDGSVCHQGNGGWDQNPNSFSVFKPAIPANATYRLRVTDEQPNPEGIILDRYIRFYIPCRGTPGNGDFLLRYRNGVFALLLNNTLIETDTITRNWVGGSCISFNIDQKLSNNTSVDSIGLWQVNQFVRYAVPRLLSTPTNQPVLRATERIVSGEKFKQWNENFGILIHKPFTVNDSGSSSFISQLDLTYTGVAIKNELLDAPDASWSEIEFRDPWFVDTTDQYGKRNRGAVEARFWSRPSPFSPDAATLYNGEAYKGVFLNQGYNAQLPNNPNYAIRTQDNLAVGGSTARFLGWSASGASLVQEQGVSDTLRKAVVFQSPTATVKALYKGRLLSSVANATSAGNQRRLANAQGATLYNNVFYLVYESAGKIWLTYTTNGGASWQPERFVVL